MHEPSFDNNRNPLLPDLEAFVTAHTDGLSEHELLNALSDHALLAGLNRHDPVDLFRKHFLLMNGLYQLQQQLWKKHRWHLEISPLNIQLLRHLDSAQQQQLSAEDSAALRDYYLDWSNLGSTSDDDVYAMLAEFWQRLGNGEDRDQALEILELSRQASRADITQRYRELAGQHHPDRGGDSDTFVRIRQAYELLMSTHR